MNAEPGVYLGLTFEQYLAIEATNNGSLSRLKKSPRHYRYATSEESSSAKTLGVLAHGALLEPLEVLRRYVVMPDYAKHPANRTKNGEATTFSTSWVLEQESQFIAMHEGRQFVSQKEFDAMLAISHSVASEPAARTILQSGGDSEVTIVWHDADTGVVCKGRIDKLNPPKLGDLKTSADVDKFRRSYRDFAYYRQLAFYLDGYAQLTGDILEPWIVLVESAPPYCVQVAPVCEEDIEFGRREYRRLLRELVRCREENDWPGPPSPEVWRLPEWFTEKSEVLELVIDGNKVRL